MCVNITTSTWYIHTCRIYVICIYKYIYSVLEGTCTCICVNISTSTWYTYMYDICNVYIFRDLDGLLTVREKGGWTLDSSVQMRCVLFTIKLLHKWFEFLCSLLMPYWLSLCIVRRIYRQNRLYENLFHTVIILSKYHHHHQVFWRVRWEKER
jgi:hypothetical protein